MDIISFGVVLYHDQDLHHPFLVLRFVGQGLLRDTLFPISLNPDSAHNEVRVQVNISTPRGTWSVLYAIPNIISHPVVVFYVPFLGVVHYSLSMDCILLEVGVVPRPSLRHLELKTRLDHVELQHFRAYCDR